MAKLWYGYPLTSITGRFGNGIYKTRNGVPFLDHFSDPTQKRHDKSYTPRKCSCQAFKYLDLQYQGFSQAEKDKWRQAVKKPGLSGYTLFMSEGLHHLTKNIPWSGEPSISGGYSHDRPMPGHRFVPPVACVLRSYSATCLETCTWWLGYYYSLMSPSYTSLWEAANVLPGWTGKDLYIYEGLYYWGIGTYNRNYPATNGYQTPPFEKGPWPENFRATGQTCNPPFYDYWDEFPWMV
jgi:hypothetical protein